MPAKQPKWDDLKKELLVVSMLNDQTVDPNSNRYIANAEKTMQKIQSCINEGKVKHDGVILVDYYGSSNSKWSGIKGFNTNNTISFEVRNDDWFSVDNVLRINTRDGGVHELNATNFDFLITPDKYNLTFCGIDLFGSMSKGILHLSNLGFTSRVYVDGSHMYGNSLNTSLRSAGVLKRVVNYTPKVKQNGTRNSRSTAQN